MTYYINVFQARAREFETITYYDHEQAKANAEIMHQKYKWDYKETIYINSGKAGIINILENES